MALHGHCRSPIMGQPDSNKGSYQKCQFLIVTLLAACHMGFVRCPYSNAVLKVWGEAIQRTWTKPPLITENGSTVISVN